MRLDRDQLIKTKWNMNLLTIKHTTKSRPKSLKATQKPPSPSQYTHYEDRVKKREEIIRGKGEHSKGCTGDNICLPNTKYISTVSHLFCIRTMTLFPHVFTTCGCVPYKRVNRWKITYFGGPKFVSCSLVLLVSEHTKFSTQKRLCDNGNSAAFAFVTWISY